MNTKDKKKHVKYDASTIEILEGLEPVRKRPGMYIGGTDNRSLHHLVTEVIDNSMDEVVAGFAKKIDIILHENNWITIRDDGRGIPVDPHPKNKKKSAAEIILCTLHAGGKFSNINNETSGGLHGVGISVVNALSEKLNLEIVREGQVYYQSYERGIPVTKLLKKNKTQKKSGTSISFKPDIDIFGESYLFKPKTIYEIAKAKAYLFSGVKINWETNSNIDNEIIKKETFFFPNGITDYLNSNILKNKKILDVPFKGEVNFSERFKKNIPGKLEWSINWITDGDGFISSYCNTIATPEGGTHENGFWSAVLKSLKSFGEFSGQKKISIITKEDIQKGICIILSIFIKDPEFVGQTKDKLSNIYVTKLVENSIKDRFENWLATNTKIANRILEITIEHAEFRIRKKNEKETLRKDFLKKIRLPGKLTDCSQKTKEGTEIFIVEGDSAGGSAKQARDRSTQAVLPLRGKVLNVVGASFNKINQNQEILDLCKALGVELGKNFDYEKLRYEKIIIMTDADVDGAHIAALLMAFFYTQMKNLITKGFLFLAVPPLYKITYEGKSFYANSDKEKDNILKKEVNGKGKFLTSRFKGLGEMNPSQLRETTMNPDTRKLIKLGISENNDNHNFDLVEKLLGKNPENRFNFISKNANYVKKLDI